MRTWQRSAIACTGSSPTAAMPTRAASTGVTAYCCGATSTTAYVTSVPARSALASRSDVMRAPPALLAWPSCAPHPTSCVDLLEELRDELARLLPAVESVPQHP